MTVRKYNFTERHRIEQTDAAITVHSSNDAFWFSADINLRRFALPDDALVFVDAHRQTKRVRFPFGTVKDVLQPPENERHLESEFPTPDVVLFRIKVVSPAGGMILAQADKINPRRYGGGRESLLHVVPADLEHACWRVHFDASGDGRPELQINKNIDAGYRDASRSPAFRALVYPAVLREILNRILRVEEPFHTDEDDNWRSQWLRLAEDKFGAGSPPLQDSEAWQIDEWINRAVAGFSRRFYALRTYGDVGNDS